MIIVFTLLHAEIGQNDHREEVPHFTYRIESHAISHVVSDSHDLWITRMQRHLKLKLM